MLLNSAPVITYYATDATGDLNRVELSQATFNNWVAKTSNLLAEEFDFELATPGETAVYLDLPLHWLHSVWLTSVWSLGGYITTQPEQARILVTGEAGVTELLQQASAEQDVVACTLGSGLDPLGAEQAATARTITPAATDYSYEVRMFADSYESSYAANPSDLAVATNQGNLSHAELAQLVAEFLAPQTGDSPTRLLLTDLPATGSASIHDPRNAHSRSATEPKLAAVIAGILGATSSFASTPAKPPSLVLCSGLASDQARHIADQERAQIVSW